ncbi:hypothetical protein HK405_007788, partial [Cladochytrium tenue]
MSSGNCATLVSVLPSSLNITSSCCGWTPSSTSTTLQKQSAIQCDSTGTDVTSITINGFGITSFPNISSLDALTTVNLEFNELTGTLPTWLASLAQLNLVHVEDNCLTISSSTTSYVLYSTDQHTDCLSSGQSGTIPTWLSAAEASTSQSSSSMNSNTVGLIGLVVFGAFVLIGAAIALFCIHRRTRAAAAAAELESRPKFEGFQGYSGQQDSQAYSEEPHGSNSSWHNLRPIQPPGTMSSVGPSSAVPSFGYDGGAGNTSGSVPPMPGQYGMQQPQYSQGSFGASGSGSSGGVVGQPPSAMPPYSAYSQAAEPSMASSVFSGADYTQSYGGGAQQQYGAQAYMSGQAYSGAQAYGGGGVQSLARVASPHSPRPVGSSGVPRPSNPGLWVTNDVVSWAVETGLGNDVAIKFAQFQMDGRRLL